MLQQIYRDYSSSETDIVKRASDDVIAILEEAIALEDLEEAIRYLQAATTAIKQI